MNPDIKIMEKSKVSPKADFEVTGVSRSGRVRKKSSKLMDFQSPDDIEPKLKKVLPVKPNGLFKPLQNFVGSSLFAINRNPDTTNIYKNEPKSDDEYSGDEYIPDDESIDTAPDSEEEIDDENDDDDENYVDPTVRQSIYILEKAKKKKVLKDGKVIYGKAQRKDKGKTRFTAYMLWARDVRQQMTKQQPDLDFATISRRLGEMWANVPTSEKYNWKRRAKRLATRSKTIDRKDGSKLPHTFLNKGTVGKNKRILINDNTNKHDIFNRDSVQHSLAKTNYPPIIPGMYKVTGTEPIDVSAYLKLLGDNLSIIGERLKEHEGQITVSGSLSVLLDSLLCSLGPLICLTTQISGFEEHNPNLRSVLHNTLDNIAYVMPGL